MDLQIEFKKTTTRICSPNPLLLALFPIFLFLLCFLNNNTVQSNLGTGRIVGGGANFHEEEFTATPTSREHCRQKK